MKKGQSEPKSEPPPAQTRPSSAPGGPSSKPYDQWSFGLFGGTGSRLVLVGKKRCFFFAVKNMMFYVICL